MAQLLRCWAKWFARLPNPDAESAVKHIEGVEKVDNQIDVLPPSPMDDGLRMRLYREIYGYPALEKYALGCRSRFVSS